MKLLRYDAALQQARTMAPTIYQRVKSIYDYLTPIHLGDFDPMLIDKPTVYFRATRDAAYNYSLYCWFHWRDWSELPVPIKALDEHRYDFEGALFAAPRPSSKVKPWACSVFHHTLRFGECASSYAFIEPGGHGVTLTQPMLRDILSPMVDAPPKSSENNNVMSYVRGSYDLLNIDDTATLHWLKTAVQPAFNANGVHLPWQWRDSRIGDASTGLIYSDPAKLYELAKEHDLL